MGRSSTIRTGRSCETGAESVNKHSSNGAAAVCAQCACRVRTVCLPCAKLRAVPFFPHDTLVRWM